MNNKYLAFKKQFDEKLNNFEGIFFAFSIKQFKEGMESLGLSPSDTEKIYRTMAGGFVLRDRSKAWNSLLNSYDDELAKLLEDKGVLLEALIYELGNHEYCVTYDDSDTLDALDLDPKTVDQDILKQAKKIYLDGCNQAA